MKYLKNGLIFSLLWLVSTLQMLAQCPMCKAAAEANLKDGGTHGMGLNTGIIYLFMTPFLIMGTLATVWFWTRYRNKQKEEAELDVERGEENAMAY